MYITSREYNRVTKFFIIITLTALFINIIKYSRLLSYIIKTSIFIELFYDIFKAICDMK